LQIKLEELNSSFARLAPLRISALMVLGGPAEFGSAGASISIKQSLEAPVTEDTVPADVARDGLITS
jgi:hypothetical protein